MLNASQRHRKGYLSSVSAVGCPVQGCPALSSLDRAWLLHDPARLGWDDI